MVHDAEKERRKTPRFSTRVESQLQIFFDEEDLPETSIKTIGVDLSAGGARIIAPMLSDRDCKLVILSPRRIRLIILLPSDGAQLVTLHGQIVGFKMHANQEGDPTCEFNIQFEDTPDRDMGLLRDYLDRFE